MNRIGSSKRGRDEWEIKDDVHTLKRAEEIKSDAARLKDATEHAAKDSAHMAKIAGMQPSKDAVMKKPAHVKKPKKAEATTRSEVIPIGKFFGRTEKKTDPDDKPAKKKPTKTALTKRLAGKVL